MAKIDEIITMLEETWDSPGFVSRRARMETDYGLYRLNPYDAGTGYQSYTSNAPRILADKIISYLSAAQMAVRVNMSAKVAERGPAAKKEKFAIGAFNLADERMQRIGQPTVREQLAFYMVLRGWYAGRAFLNKRSDGSTFVDITPFDPLRCVYELDDEGVVWLAQKTRRSASSVRAQYKIDVEPTVEKEKGTAGMDVWDFYSREEHGIIIATGNDNYAWGKKLTKHNIKDSNNHPVAPIFLGAVGPAPWIQTETSSDDSSRDFGESIFAANRSIYDDLNFAMSAYKTLVRRAVRRPYKVISPDGTTTLDSDPWQDGSEVPLPAGTDIRLLDEITMPVDAPAFVGQVSGELQRGGLSNVSYGELPFAISGFAAKVLQEGSSHQIEPRVKAMTACYKQIAELLAMQYEIGAFKSIDLRGRHNDVSSFFHEEIAPKDIKGAGAFEIKFGVRMPQDEPQLITMAQMMREGQRPLAPDEWIWENVLQISDVDQFRNAINAQQAHTTEPKALLITLIEGLMQTGEQEKAMIYIDLLRRTLKEENQKEQTQDVQFQQLMGQAQAMAMQQQMQGGMGQGAGVPPEIGAMTGGGSPPGISNDILSSQMQGFTRAGNPVQAPPGSPGGPGPRNFEGI